jgi:hypothetical protein
MPFGYFAAGVVSLFIMALVFAPLGPLGALLLFAGGLAYGGLVMSGMMGLWGAAAGTGRAVWADLADGTKRFFWRAVGYLALFAGSSLLISIVVGGSVLAPLLGRIAMGEVDPSAVASSGTMLGMQIAGLVVSLLVFLLFFFGPAVMRIEDAPVLDGIGRGVRFVTQRFGLVVALAAAWLVIYYGPPWLVSLPFRSLIAGGLSATSPAVDPALMAALPGLLMVGFFAAVYCMVAGSFIMLASFVAYGRSRPADPGCDRPAGK